MAACRGQAWGPGWGDGVGVGVRAVSGALKPQLGSVECGPGHCAYWSDGHPLSCPVAQAGAPGEGCPLSKFRLLQAAGHPRGSPPGVPGPSPRDASPPLALPTPAPACWALSERQGQSDPPLQPWGSDPKAVFTKPMLAAKTSCAEEGRAAAENHGHSDIQATRPDPALPGPPSGRGRYPLPASASFCVETNNPPGQRGSVIEH